VKLKEISVEQLPRERLFASGSDSLSDAEILALLLNTGSKEENVIDVSNRLISKYGLNGISCCSLSELTTIKGIGPAKASKIFAAFELSRRANSGKIAKKSIQNSEDVALHYIEKLKGKKKEHLIVILLDSKNRIIKEEIVSIGTLNSSLIHPREVFKPAIKESANAIILVHNHPSGDCDPSSEDKEITKILVEAGKLLNISVLDHIVVGKDDYSSMVED
jgi:DNA repair protein RadC